MKIYQPGADITVLIPLIDGEGQPIVSPSTLTADVRVIDEDGAVVIGWTAANMTGMSSVGEFKYVVGATSNTIPATETSALRRVELKMTIGAETVIRSATYILELASSLATLVDSFQTFDRAQLTRRSLAELPGWDAASEDQQVRALRMAYDLLGSFLYKFETVDGSTWNGSISDLTSEQWADLADEQKKDFLKAQVIQADYNLGGSPIEKRIEAGMQSSTVGEVSQFYRPRASLVLPACRTALKYVGRYIIWNVSVGRA